ncbi:FadR/GntR family transcriptional regulator [Proteus mirabilis]|uniref:FadR/GntR family transcriptional regulator n=1 Tax=Proteus mirabilis TaxID=584 RepID=UPI0023B1E9AD|nr:GntR family transcriptional regulator [Proteus mirabilis]
MIKKISRQKASQQILDQIKQNIYDGTYPIGEKLPSENVLADAFGVSRVPIREALGVLEASGIITSRQGGGRRVIDHSILSKYEPIVMEIACPQEIESLLEMREVIEHEAGSHCRFTPNTRRIANDRASTSGLYLSHAEKQQHWSSRRLSISSCHYGCFT